MYMMSRLGVAVPPCFPATPFSTSTRPESTSVLPDTPLFLYMYVRKEALLSSQIEGTQSSLSDLLMFENDETPGVPLADVEEVSEGGSVPNLVVRNRASLPILIPDGEFDLGRIRERFEVSSEKLPADIAGLVSGKLRQFSRSPQQD